MNVLVIMIGSSGEADIMVEMKHVTLVLGDGTLIEVTADPEFEIDLEVYP